MALSLCSKQQPSKTRRASATSASVEGLVTLIGSTVNIWSKLVTLSSTESSLNECWNKTGTTGTLKESWLINYLRFRLKLNRLGFNRDGPWSSGTDWDWQKMWIVESDSATDRRILRRERRPRTRRNENSARASRRPVRRARVISLCTLCCLREFASSPTAVAAAVSVSDSICFSTPSLHNGFFKYIFFLFVPR